MLQPLCSPLTKGSHNLRFGVEVPVRHAVRLLIPERAGNRSHRSCLVIGRVQVPGMTTLGLGLCDGDPEPIPTAIRVAKHSIDWRREHNGPSLAVDSPPSDLELPRAAALLTR